MKSNPSAKASLPTDLLVNRKLHLIVGFAAMFSVAALVTMASLMWGLGAIQEDLEEILGAHKEKMSLVVEMRNAARARTMRLSNMILFEDPFDKDEEYLEFNKFGAEFVRARLKLLEHTLTTKEKEFLNEQGKFTEPAVNVQRQIVDLVYADNMEQAHKLLTGQAIPLQDRVMEQLTHLYEYQESSLDTAIEQAEQNYNTIRNWILIFSIVAGVIGSFVAMFIIWRNKQASKVRENYLRQIEHANSQLELERNRAEKANNSKSQFLANMSHELRTPLNAIIGYSEMLKEEFEDDDLPKVYSDDCDRIHDSGEHLLHLINEVLDLSKIEAGKMTVASSSFRVDTLVNSVIDIISPLAEKKGNRVEVDYRHGEANLTTDDTKLKQVLMNVVSNANKFTENGIIKLVVKSTVENGIRWIAFKVQDNGIGIPEDKLQNIFEPFEQADDSNTRSFEGTGLGLTITKRFCEMLNGSVWIESKLGKGTAIHIKIPDQQAVAENGNDVLNQSKFAS